MLHVIPKGCIKEKIVSPKGTHDGILPVGEALSDDGDVIPDTQMIVKTGKIKIVDIVLADTLCAMSIKAKALHKRDAAERKEVRIQRHSVVHGKLDKRKLHVIFY